jgi:hypothetical protein
MKSIALNEQTIITIIFDLLILMNEMQILYMQLTFFTHINIAYLVSYC